MKVLVATRESQGARAWDAWHAGMEGELVRPAEGWPWPRASALRLALAGFIGLSSRGVTTTARVVEAPRLSHREYTLLVRGSLGDFDRTTSGTDRSVAELLDAAIGLAGPGVVERWGDRITVRFDDRGALRPDPAGGAQPLTGTG